VRKTCSTVTSEHEYFSVKNVHCCTIILASNNNIAIFRLHRLFISCCAIHPGVVICVILEVVVFLIDVQVVL